MATARITVSSEPTIYHVIIRVTRGSFVWGGGEGADAQDAVAMADFPGVEVLTYVVMTNHLHIVCRVSAEEVENAEVLRRFGVLYEAKAMQEAKANLVGGPPETGGGVEDAAGHSQRVNPPPRQRAASMTAESEEQW